MPSEISTNKVLLTSKASQSRWLAISNLPHTATEETIKECFQRYGRIQSIRIDDQRFAFIGFFDRQSASKAHHAETILDEQQLRTAFHDGSNSVPKVLLEVSPVISSIVEPLLSSPSSTATLTSTVMDKTVTAIHDEREKHTLRTTYSPEENTRHQVVPIKRDVNIARSERRTSLVKNSKPTTTKSLPTKHEKSSSSSPSNSNGSPDNSSSYQHASNFKRVKYGKTRILKISHLPSKMSHPSLREKLRNLFADFKKSSHLLTIKIIDDYALLTFQKCEDVNKALLFVMTKSINGIRLKAEPYDILINDIDEYSIKATRTLYVGNLQSEVSHNELREIYSEYGDIIEIEIKRQQQSAHSQIFAFIQYTNIKSVVKAMKALDSTVVRDHSVKLGFGKSQPTNVLWLDDLPSTITESNLRSFLHCLTNLSSDEILDIYIDHQTCSKHQIVQCLIYFIDVIAAQNAINSIRGKKLQSQRIQVDFASKVFLTRFADIIQQITSKKNSDRLPNQSHQTDRRYSKVSDAESSLTLSNMISSSQNQSHRLSSSSDHSSINQKKLINSDSDKDANSERIFDWLMQNSHSNGNHHDEEETPREQISIKNPKESNTVPVNPISSQHLPTKIFQTKIIPLESDCSLIPIDIRLKVYASMSNQSIRSIHLPLPRFAKPLMKSLNILNPKAHLKHLSVGLKTISTEQELINVNRIDQESSIQRELDERIRLLDQQMYEINQKNLLRSPITNTTVNTQQTSPSALSRPSELSLLVKSNSTSSTITLHPSIPSSMISPPPPSSSSSMNRLTSPLSNDKSMIIPSLTFSFDSNTDSSLKLLERLGPSAKFKHKSIPPPLSVITTLPILSNTSNSPMFLTPKSMTPTDAVGNQNHSPAFASSPIKPSIVNHSPKPTVLKSILKQPSCSSPSIANETRKAVHIIAINPSFQSTAKQIPPSDDKKKAISQQNPTNIVNDRTKHQTEAKKPLNPSITSMKNSKLSLGRIPKKTNIKPTAATVKIPKLLKTTTTGLSVKTKDLDAKLLKPTHHLKTNISEINKKSISSSIPQKKISLVNNEILKRHNQQIVKKPLSTTKQSPSNKSSSSTSKIDQKLVTKSSHTIKIEKKSRNKFNFKQHTCMYDRIKKRARNETIRHSLLSAKDDRLSDERSNRDAEATNIIRLKRPNPILDSSESENDTLTKTKKIAGLDGNIFDTEENANKKIEPTNDEQMKVLKLNQDVLVAKKKLTNSLPRKRSFQEEINEPVKKKMCLEPVTISSVKEEQINKFENTVSEEVETTSSHLLSISVDTTLDNDETIPSNNLVDSDQHEHMSSAVASPTTKTEPECFDREQIPDELSSRILPDESELPLIETSSNKEPDNVVQEQNSHSSSTPLEETSTKTNPFLIDNIKPSDLPPDHPHIITDEIKPSCFSPSSTHETRNQSDSRPIITSHKHSTTPMHLFPQLLPTDSTIYTPHHQHFPYPLFTPSPDSPPLSARTLSTSSCSSAIGNPLYNTLMSGQQYCFEKEFRRDSLSKFSTTSSNQSIRNNQVNAQKYFGSDSMATFRNPSDYYNYTETTQQILNSFYHLNEIQSCNPCDIQWEGYIILKTDQAYIKTQLIVGNPHIARISINYWNSDLNHNLRISQRMRLEEIQLDGVQKHMQMDNDYCILIAEPHGITPEELRSEQNHLKNGVIQYLNEKQAAGIINILLPGVIQPVYVVHIFPPCQFASEILQKRAPDAYRCVVQNKTEQIYLLFIITTTV